MLRTNGPSTGGLVVFGVACSDQVEMGMFGRAGCPGWQSKLLPSLVAVPGPLTFDHGSEIRW